MDEVWGVLIDEFLSKMRQVECNAEEFRYGLQFAIEEIQIEIKASEEML